jgi:hypothetical protein
MDGSLLWRSALAQAVGVVLLSGLLALLLPHSFFEDWGWLSGPLAWFACAALTARLLRLPLRDTLLGALLAGLLSGAAVLAGIHWLGVAIAIGAFALWCARPRGARGGALAGTGAGG